MNHTDTQAAAGQIKGQLASLAMNKDGFAFNPSTGDSYTVAGPDAEKFLRVVVTGTADGYATESITSDISLQVQAGTFGSTPAPTVSGPRPPASHCQPIRVSSTGLRTWSLSDHFCFSRTISRAW